MSKYETNLSYFCVIDVNLKSDSEHNTYVHIKSFPLLNIFYRINSVFNNDFI